MRIGIIGMGDVGETLGRVWADLGHDVCFGVRDPDEGARQSVVDEIGGRVRVADLRETAEHGEVVVLAVPGQAVGDAAARVADVVAGKPLVDATNRFDDPDRPQSVAIRAAAPDAKIVKAFNTVGYEWFAEPTADGETATMFLAGDDGAKAPVVDLAEDCGFEVVDAGSIEAAAMLEDLARFWVHLAGEYGRDVAFRLLRR